MLTQMPREIGGEFWEVPRTEGVSSMFPASTQWYLSGRSALRAIVRELSGCNTVALPSWCCDSMIRPFTDVGMEVRFYSVFKGGIFVCEPRLDCDALLVMDYFGYGAPAPELSDYGGLVVRDMTHAVFSRGREDANYYFGSLRKWCGLWTGGFAWRDNSAKLASGVPDQSGYAGLRERAMLLKGRYLAHCANVRLEPSAKETYLHMFAEAEELLERADAHPAAARDAELVAHLDVDFIVSRRRANARVLMEALGDWLVFPKMGEGDCPLFVPVLVPDGKRDALRRHLIEHDIYCPVHWPISSHHDLSAKDAFPYADELSLVCDQRYAEGDMIRIVETIAEFMERG